MAPIPEIKKWTIYKITNPVGQVYIGCTSNYKKRISYYKYKESKSQPLIHNSILTYGFDNHKIDILEEFNSHKLFAEGKEIFWIRGYMSNRNKWPQINGLNDCDGGAGTLGKPKSEKEKLMSSIRNTGYKHTEEAKNKIAEASKGNKYSVGKKRTEEWKLKMKELQKGNKYNVGRILSFEHKEALRNGFRKKFPIKEKLLPKDIRKGIIQYDLNGNIIGEFISASEAARQLGIRQGAISRVALGKRNHTHNFIFKYK